MHASDGSHVSCSAFSQWVHCSKKVQVLPQNVSLGNVTDVASAIKVFSSKMQTSLIDDCSCALSQLSHTKI